MSLTHRIQVRAEQPDHPPREGQGCLWSQALLEPGTSVLIECLPSLAFVSLWPGSIPFCTTNSFYQMVRTLVTNSLQNSSFDFRQQRSSDYLGCSWNIIPPKSSDWPGLYKMPPLDQANVAKETHPVRTDMYCCFCYSAAQWCLILCDCMDCSTPGFSVRHYLPEFATIHVHWVGNAI